MEEHGDCTSGVCPGASADGVTISIYVPHHHPLLQRKRALPWDTLFEVMGRHWRRAGKNTDGRPGLPWDMALYVPLVVLMLVKRLNTRDMEAYVSENVVARVFIGRQDDPSPQIRDHSNSARAYTALGKDGVDEINAVMLHVARDCGFADVSILSSDTTAQELPIGYPNAPGILRGMAQRGGRALAKRKTRAVVGVDTALAQVQTILRTVKEHHLFAKGKQAKRQVRFVSDVPLNASHADLRVNFLECWEWDKDTVQHFSWVTDLRVNKGTVYQIMRGGRARWRIENETFNTLKNQGYHFEHNDGHGYQHLSVVFAVLMMLAFFVDQVQQLCCPLCQAVWAKLGSKRRLWERMRALFYDYALASMRQLFEALLYGLKKTTPIFAVDSSSSPWICLGDTARSRETTPCRGGKLRLEHDG